MVELILGDCIEVMRGMANSIVDLIATDPPYFMAKDESWDQQWSDEEEYLGWIDLLCREWRRVLKPNGSLYVFAGQRMASKVECVIGCHFRVLNRITWRKPPYSTKAEMFRKEDLRSFFPASEAIIFAEQYPSWPRLLREAREASGLSRQEVSQFVVGSPSGACWNWEAGIRFPEREHWERLRQLLPGLPAYDEIERPFFASPDGLYTDVWEFPTVAYYRGKHPCEKPVTLMEHIIRTSSRPGDLVLDCFAGSGTTGVAAIRTGRRAILIEKESRYVAIAKRRIAEEERRLAVRNGSLFSSAAVEVPS